MNIACIGCVHVKRDRLDENGVPTCEAFPYGIPREISSGEDDHSRPIEGDHGICYTEALEDDDGLEEEED